MKTPTISSYKTAAISSLVSLGDIVFSFAVAMVTGSSVMFAQGLQGFADLITTLFVLLGVKRSERAADSTHPFGFGREVFFWVLISSLFAFLVNGGIASYNAIRSIIDGSELNSITIAFVALSFGIMTNGYALSNSLKRLSQGAAGKSLWSYVRHSSLVETKMTLLVDLMGTISAGLGLLALGIYLLTGNPIFDALGALTIGLLTAAGALFVIVDLHDLIVGRSPLPQTVHSIREAALKPKGVINVLDLRSTTIGSGKLLVILEVHFEDNITTDDIEKITDEIKASVLKSVPQVEQVQVEAETPE